MYEANCKKKEILWCFLPGKGGPVGKKCSSDTGRADSAYKASNSISQNWKLPLQGYSQDYREEETSLVSQLTETN